MLPDIVVTLLKVRLANKGTLWQLRFLQANGFQPILSPVAVLRNWMERPEVAASLANNAIFLASSLHLFLRDAVHLDNL